MQTNEKKVKLMTCQREETMQRVSPKSVCLQLLANLEVHEKLDSKEQSTVLLALKNTGIEVDRILANLTREAISIVNNKI